MVDFLDTSIIVNSTTDFERDYEKSLFVLKNHDWRTTERVVSELRTIKERRKDIYKKIIGYKFRTEAVFEDLYKKCFIHSCHRNNNDYAHVTNIFRHALRECNAGWKDVITPEMLEKFKGCIFPTITSIKVKSGMVIANFDNNPIYRDQHVIPNVVPTNKCKDLQKYLREELRNSIAHKGDIKILINAILHGYYVHEVVIFRSTHGFFNDSENIEKLKESIRRFYPDHPGLEVKDLSDVIIIKDTTLSNILSA